MISTRLLSFHTEREMITLFIILETILTTFSNESMSGGLLFWNHIHTFLKNNARNAQIDYDVTGAVFHDSISPLKPLNRIQRKLDRKQDLNVLYQVLCFSGRSKKQDGRPGLWLAETFSTSPLKLLNGIQWNVTGSKTSTSSTKFVFFGPMSKQNLPP